MTKVPNLRFNNFNDAWQEHVLGDIFEFYTTNSFSRDFLDNDNGSVKNIHYGDIHMKFPTILDVKNKQIPYVKEPVDLSKISIEAYCQNGDVVIADASEDYNDIGKAIELKNVGGEKLLAGLHTILARDNKQIMVNGFRGYLMSSPNVRKQIKVYAAGAKVLGISKANISKVSLLIPSSMEQEKIASFFSLIDKKIELQTEKVEELANYKKGIMQKIFSQELRFKDENGDEYPEWEEVNLRKILKEVSEKTTVINQYEVISSTNNGLYLQKDYFNREIASKDNIGYKILKRNQVVLSPQNLWMGNINLNSKYDIGMVSPSYKIFDIKSEFDSSYIGFILRTDRAFYEYKQASEQGASIVRRNLNMDLFYDISFKLPCKAEQYKISKFINKIDCKIEQEMEKLDSLNQYKKGLLQQMFI